MILYLAPFLEKYFNQNDSRFNALMQLRGEVFRSQPGRITERAQLGEEYFFIKKHHGVGWREIFKNLLMGRLPVLSAKNEWLAIQKLQSHGVFTPEVVGYGLTGHNPATLRSFLLMRELAPVISLESLGMLWQKNPPTLSFKRAIITELARTTKIMHAAGVNHRDYYLCHFLLDQSPEKEFMRLYLIDLHRAQIRDKVPTRWLIKDLAGLYFSSLGFGYTRNDYFRFIKLYRQKTLRDILQSEHHFWDKVKKRGKQLHDKHNS